MTDDRSLERAARSWIEHGPIRVPDSVIDAALLRIETTPQDRIWLPRRLWPSRRTGPRVAVAVVVMLLALAGGYLLGFGATVVTTVPPSVGTPSPSALSDGLSLTETLVSERYGYSVRYPTGWRITRATADWITVTTDWGSPVVDELRGRDIRLSVASQRLGVGETPAERLQTTLSAVGPCDARRPAPDLVSIDGHVATVAMNGCSTVGLPGSMTPNGFAYLVVLVTDDRVYYVILDGNVDPAILEEILATMTLTG